MADEPVKAWREPWSRRARRWARQNRTAVTSLAAAVLVALAGTAAVLAVQTRSNRVLTAKNDELDKANRLKDEANSGLREANQRVTKANADLESANVREKQRFDLAKEAIKLFHGEVGDDLVLKADQFKPLRDKLLKGAADFYVKLEGLLEGQTDRTSRGAMGDAYFELGELTAKIGNLSKAFDVHRKSLAVRRSLAAGSDATAAEKLDVVRSLIADGRLAAQTGDVSGALAAFDEARGLTEGLITSGVPDDEARETLALIDNYTAIVMRDNAGKPLDALKILDRVLPIRRALAEANPSVERFQSDLANSYNQVGIALTLIGKPSEALEAFGRSLAIRQKLADAKPAVIQFRSDVAKTYNNIGAVLQRTDRLAEAIDAFGKSVATRQKLADANPAVTQFQYDLALSHDNLGVTYRGLRKLPEALAEIGRSMAVYQKLAETNPAVTSYAVGLAKNLSQKALILYELGEPSRAIQAFRDASAIVQKLADSHPDVPEFQIYLCALPRQHGGPPRQGRPDPGGDGLAREVAFHLREACGRPSRGPRILATVRDHVDRSGSVARRTWRPGRQLAALPLRAGLPDQDQGADARAPLPDGPRPRENRRAAGEPPARSRPPPGRRARRPFRRRDGAAESCRGRGLPRPGQHAHRQGHRRPAPAPRFPAPDARPRVPGEAVCAVIPSCRDDVRGLSINRDEWSFMLSPRELGDYPR